VAFEGAMTDLCRPCSVTDYIICMFACAMFGFNGDVILSVAYFKTAYYQLFMRS
jgi:hypothetical protein